jgi:periplasmic protein TonB
MKPRNDLAYRLIVRAAHRTPVEVSERLEEEWLADLESRTGALARLRLALGCCWATGVITRDLRIPQLAASGAIVGAKPLFGDLRLELPGLSRRTVTFILIAGFHILLIYALTSGLAQHLVATTPQPANASVLEEARPQRPPPPPPPAGFKAVVIKPSDLRPLDPQQIDYTADDAIGVPTPAPGPAGPAPAGVPQVAKRVPGGPGSGFPNPDDYYPSASRRLAETGAATVQVCVDMLGRLTAEPTLGRSSGSRRLDAGALDLARAGSGHYRPTTENGQPISSCYPYRIRFELAN